MAVGDIYHGEYALGTPWYHSDKHNAFNMPLIFYNFYGKQMKNNSKVSEIARTFTEKNMNSFKGNLKIQNKVAWIGKKSNKQKWIWFAEIWMWFVKDLGSH